MSTKRLTVLTTLAACAVLAGCSAQHYREQADRAAYGIVAAKTPRVPGMPAEFTIERRPDAGPQALPEGPVTLADALRIATLNSRDYQDRKESLFLSALSLSGTRNDYAANWFGSLSADYEDTDTGDEKEIGGSSSFGFSRLLSSGANLSVGLATSLSKLLTGDRAEAASSAFDLTVTQPLLRGFGVDTNESLTQAERNMVYQMRDFVRYRRNFYIGIVEGYYDALRQEQVLENERKNYENLSTARVRAELRFETDRSPRFEVDETKQRELDAENRLQAAEQSYRSRLDSFKLTLGLPTEVTLTLDPGEQTRLVESFAAVEFELSADRAAEIALENRLDLITARQEAEDAERAVRIARLDLLPGLDVTASTDVDTEGDAKPLNFKAERTDYSIGLDLDLPLDTVDERNSYRSSLIELDRTRRDYEESRDRIGLDVRNSWRDYDFARKSYAIQEEGERLADKRVEGAKLKLEDGRGTTREMLDAQEDLVNAQNSKISALVNCKVAGLQLAHDMGILVVEQEGQLKENFDAYR
jgi:outer membrane protein TolC